MLEIQLTRGYTTIIDDDDADLADQKWYALKSHNSLFYAVHTIYPNGRKEKCKQEFMGRIVLERKLGHLLAPDEFVDHVDCNSLNNTRANLRACTRSQNSANRRPFSRKFPLKGTQKVGNIWVARIGANGKSFYLGTFKTDQEAHQAYCEAAERLHGEFARSE